MKRIGIIGMCFAAVLAFSVMAVASASATEVLFSSATGTFKATGGTASLNGASKVECVSSSSSGIIETAHLGKLTVLFEKCSTQLLGTHLCHNSGTENIQFTGTFHLGLTKKTGVTESLSAGILVLNPTAGTEFECNSVGKVKVLGSVIGLLQTKAGGHLVPEEALLHSVTAFQGSGKTQSHSEFSLPLTTPENELMTGQVLNSEIFGVKGESSEIASGEITEATPTGVHLVTG